MPGVENLKPDFEREVVIVATKDARAPVAYHELKFVGQNGARTVLRLTPPMPMFGLGNENAKPELCYAVWIIPKPQGVLIVETPKYPPARQANQPANWLEEYEFK
jgi:hypothetical protein